MDATRKYCIEWGNSDPDKCHMYYLICLSLLWIFRYEGITYSNKRNQENKNGPRVGERTGYLKKGTAGHRCYKKGTGKIIGTLIGERVEWANREKGTEEREMTLRLFQKGHRKSCLLFCAYVILNNNWYIYYKYTTISMCVYMKWYHI